jgi:thymidylate synthase
VIAVEAATLGEGWLAVSGAILESGAEATWGGSPTREVALLTLAVEQPDSSDRLIAELGDAEWLDWMHRNFFVHEEVAELGRARSYAQRLFDYAGSGRDQIAWVVSHLFAAPNRRATRRVGYVPSGVAAP